MVKKTTYNFRKNISVIIQARLTSKRLPGKSLMKIKDMTLIELLIKRLKKSKYLKNIIFAIPDNKENYKLKNYLIAKDYKVFSGDEHDVLNRYYRAAKKFNLKYIVRITADCPLIDPKILDEVIELFFIKKSDYSSNICPPSFPDGLDVEIFSFKTLKKIWRLSKNLSDREHVTQFLRNNPHKFKISNLLNNENFSNLKISVDNKSDLNLVREIVKLQKNIYFGWRKIFKHKKMKITRLNGQKLWDKAKKIIPGGNMLLSKREDRFLPGKWPNYFKKAKGCYVWDIDGRKLLDMSLMGIGTSILGYANKKIDLEVSKKIKDGNMSTLNCTEEVKLAEELIKLHPWARMAKFTRSGGEANAVAIRIARASTGKEGVAVCGYHGWHDWYIAANLKGTKNLNKHLVPGISTIGVPKSLSNTIFTFDYNNFNQLKKIVNNNPKIGIIKMEVERNIKPKNNFLQKVRKFADEKKIILIFDECTSGFRETLGGLHLKYKINPDLAIFGKALGNGYAINAIIGKEKYMKFANKSFISSTFWTERIGPSAALKTLEIMKKEKSWIKISRVGKKIKKGWMQLAKKNKLKISISGIDALCSFNFQHKNNQEFKTLISQEMLEKNILASNTIYVSTLHNDNILKRYFSVLNRIFNIIHKCQKGDDIYKYLKSPVITSGFKRLN